MRPNLTPAAWLDAVFASTLSAPTKVVLRAYHQHMRRDLSFSVPQTKIAKAVNRSTRAVDRAISEAYRARWIDLVQRGQKGRTATYKAILPTAFSPTLCNGLRPATSVGLKLRAAELRGSTTGAPSVQSDTNVGPVVTEPPTHDCEWHDHLPCDSDCANYPRSA